MEYKTPKSKCSLCNSEFTRQGLTKHIKSCLTKHFTQKSKAKPAPLLYLNISDAFNPDYFLHLLISENATLKNLDAFLRDIWLECCGHMSSFSRQRYGDEINMKHKIKDVFTPGTELIYQYDFGSTTELSVKAVAYYHGAIERNKKVQVVARNSQPIIPCDECSVKPAVQICTECQWDQKGWLCEACSKTHGCDDEMFLPVVNSPRTGVCGYTGD
jgi:hypothetical protein